MLAPGRFASPWQRNTQLAQRIKVEAIVLVGEKACLAITFALDQAQGNVSAPMRPA